MRFTCEVEGCGKDYSRKSTLKQHMMTAHKKEEVKQGRFSCSQCDKSFYHATKLVTHCQDDHQLKICMKIIVILTFVIIACSTSYSDQDIEVSKLENIS